MTDRLARRYPRSQPFRPLLETLEDRVVPTKLPKGFVEVPIASGLLQPTAMEFSPDGRLFVLEQSGAVRVIKDGALLPNPFVSIPVDIGPRLDSQRGLLGIAFDPDFVSNSFVYFYYSHFDGPGEAHNQVSRFTADGDESVEGSEEVIFELPPLGSPYQNGGAIHFGIDNFLYIGVGDNEVAGSADSLNTTLGKLLRINADGSIPDSNPFFNDPNVVDENKAIWASGLRNPFKFGIDRSDGRILINDLGQESVEEIDPGIAGADYGWPDAQGKTANPDDVDPVFAYKHGTGLKKGCAITGGAFYRPTNLAFGTKVAGDYFFADLCNGWIRVLDSVKNRAAKFAKDLPAALTDLQVDANGNLWYCSLDGGVVRRIEKPVATARSFSSTDSGLLLLEAVNAKASSLRFPLRESAVQHAVQPSAEKLPDTAAPSMVPSVDQSRTLDFKPRDGDALNTVTLLDEFQSTKRHDFA